MPPVAPYTSPVQISARPSTVIIAFFVRLTLATALIAPPVFALQTFDPEQVDSQVAVLDALLSQDNVSVEKIQDVQRRTGQIRNGAMRCVREGQELVRQLESDLELLGTASGQDPAELIEQRTTLEVETKRAEARVGACRLVMLHTQQVLEKAAALQAKLNTRRLTEHGPSGPGAVARAVRNPGIAFRSAVTAIADDPQLRGISRGRWALVVISALMAGGIGWSIRKITLEWCNQQRGRAGKPTVSVTLLRRLSENSPLLLAGATATIALALYSPAPRSDIFLFRFGLAILLYGLGRALINWISGNFSPGTELLSKDSYIQSTRSRLHALLVAIILCWLVLGSGWLRDVPADSVLAVRTLLTIYLVAALWWVLRLGRVVPTLRNRLTPLRILLAIAALTAVGAELAGYRNMANYLLRGTLATMAAGLILWTVVWAMRQSLQGIFSGTNTLSYRIRSWMGIRQEEKSAELGWLYVVTTVALWIGFAWYLIWVWDPTGNAIPFVRGITLDGIEIGGKTLVPKNIFIGVTAFGVLIALTAWLKARLHRRWLRDMGMDRHAREALVTVSGYAGFGVAAIVSLSLAGVSFAGMAVVFGLLSVGIGFGLQNIVNNFASGLILLFERPVKPGDYVTIGDIEGIVKVVRTRATEVETLDRQNVLVPNSELVSNRVTNWMLHDSYGRLIITVGVAYGSDPVKVTELLVEIGNNHPEVVTSGRTPGPRALFMSFGDSALEFELRVWIRHIEKRFGVISDINMAIDAAFREHDIVIPFPQRDVHHYGLDKLPASKTEQTDANSSPS